MRLPPPPKLIDRRGEYEYEKETCAAAVKIREPYSRLRTGDCAPGALVRAEANCGLLNFSDCRAAARSSKLACAAAMLLSEVGAKRNSSWVLRSPFNEKVERHRGASSWVALSASVWFHAFHEE